MVWAGILIICGAALARGISGYRRRARVGAAIGTAAMLTIGAYLTRMSLGGRIYNDMIWTFLIGTLSLTVCGGVLGAVAGAISCGPARRWRTWLPFGSDVAERALDHLFVGRRVRVLHTEVLSDLHRLSDHLPLLSRIQLV